MTTLLEKFEGQLGWKITGKDQLAQYQKQSGTVAKGLAKIGALYTGIAGIVTGFVAHTNAATASNYRLAQSLGVSYEWLDRWGDATESLGIGAQSIGQAFSHLQKTIGNAKLQPGQMAGLNGALKAIGINFKDLQAYDPATQFDSIVYGLSQIDDRALQFSVSSKLFGRSAGAAFAKLAQQAKAEGKSVQELIGRFDDLGIETEQSARGALQFTEQWEALRQGVSETKDALAGYIGEALTPMLKGFREWISANREIIKSKLQEWARGAATWLKGVWSFISKISGAIGPLVSAFGGLGNVLRFSAIGYLAVKLAQATKGVKDLTLGFGKLTKTNLKNFFTGPEGVAGLAGVAMLAISDLMDSLDDISNNSWGNRLARQMLKISDYAAIWVGEMAGLYFQSNADRDKFAAALMGATVASFETAYNTIANYLSNVQVLVSRVTLYVMAFGKALKESFSNPAMFSTNLANNLKAIQPTLSKFQYTKAVDTRQPYIKAMAEAGGGSYTKDMKKQYFNQAANSAAQAAVANQTNNITINAPQGLNEKQLAKHVQKELEKRVSGAVKNFKAAGQAY